MTVRWSEKELADYNRRRVISPTVVDMPPFMPPPNEAGHFARGRLPDHGMNKTEAAYADYLELQRRAGEVLWFRYEPLKLRLADGSYYKPDFGVLVRDGFFECHETKGFWREAARVRIKVAASIYPFRFIAVTRKGGQWQRETF